MAVYYHARSLIFAVANDYCSDVLDRGHDKMGTNLVGSRLLGEVASPLDEEVIPIQDIKIGHRLKFEVGTACFISEVVELVESVQSLSMPPAKMPSFPPEPGSFREPIATIPEIILPKPPGIPES